MYPQCLNQSILDGNSDTFILKNKELQRQTLFTLKSYTYEIIYEIEVILKWDYKENKNKKQKIFLKKKKYKIWNQDIQDGRKRQTL